VPHRIIQWIKSDSEHQHQLSVEFVVVRLYIRISVSFYVSHAKYFSNENTQQRKGQLENINFISIIFSFFSGNTQI
jgi:hypothetical protein